MSSSSQLANLAITKPVQQKCVQAFLALYDNQQAGCGGRVDQAHASGTFGFQPDQKEEIFSDDIIFRDPTIVTRGIEDYKRQFAALHSVFRRIHLQVVSTTTGKGLPFITGKQDASEPHIDIIFIESMCTMELHNVIQPKIRLLTRLGITDGKIVTHEDIWSYADLIDSIPLVGHVYRVIQPLAGKMLGFAFARYYAWKGGVSMRGINLHTNVIHSAYHPIESTRCGAKSISDVIADDENGGVGGEKASGGAGKQKGGQRSGEHKVGGGRS